MTLSLDFINSLNELCTYLDDKYYINSGGCCLVSYIIAKNLQQRKIRYNLVFCFDRNFNYPKSKIQLRHDVKNNADYLRDSINHYCIKVDNYYINPGYFINNSRYSKRTCTLINYSNILWIYQNGNWNTWFNTKNSRKVESEINKLFKKYDRTSRKH